MQGYAPDFYTTVAQIIPIMLILIAVEFRLVDFTEWKSGDPVGFLIMATSAFVGLLLAAIIGEIAALRVLDNERASSEADFLIVIALVSMAATIIVFPVMDARSKWLQARKDAGQPDTRLALTIGQVGLLVVGLATLVIPVVSVVVGVIAIL
jgi:hypothetical protein